MLTEFAAAVVVLSEAFGEAQRGDMDMDVDGCTETDDIPSPVKEHIGEILAESYPTALPYHRHCVAIGHKDLVWTGPPLTILPRSEAHSMGLGCMMSGGEQLDLPGCLIFSPPSTPMSAPQFPTTATKRQRSKNGNSSKSKKRRL